VALASSHRDGGISPAMRLGPHWHLEAALGPVITPTRSSASRRRRTGLQLQLLVVVCS
jgi:hypothetical protein